MSSSLLIIHDGVRVSIPTAVSLTHLVENRSGGYVYRGSYFSDLLYGAYVFADFGAM